MTLEPWAWSAVLLLGLWHGLNPGMGWLFAVALGMQEDTERAVWRALLPLAVGHAVAVGAAVGLVVVAGRTFDPGLLRWGVSALLIGFGVWRLARGRHPRWSKMRVNARELATWSLLMATAHGAGLMVMPFVLGPDLGSAALEHGAVHSAMLVGVTRADLGAGLATLLHTGGYLVATAGLAILVYRRLGLRLLRTAWVNLDLLWGAALVATGVVTPLL